LTGVLVLAQFQVNNRVNTGLYGGSSSMGSVRYGAGSSSYSGTLLPSESRYEARKTGLLPSEMKMNANAAGPLAPTKGSYYTNPSYKPIQPHSWSYQGSLGSVHNAPIYSRPAGVNPYLTSRGSARY
jgi:hypothetical protein